ncbi:putative mycocerosic acid synthase protein [Phaeoacremonium minimum UCRPA7]|uniref:Putative mycocerosic acid synthase protein n=1 Tax=Phaeoacremonium minimum (strain UCR-PA7) TaxID=1286976 RepID=R8BJU2_PHAM7|nr:putative mycocerosic acid synthase protein [Phaeoacremonium minimum UCRPA7]EON99623.1 putative mycocerosic acid synthase protein [Phaeoacremonium minimum UCRPA7]
MQTTECPRASPKPEASLGGRLVLQLFFALVPWSFTITHTHYVSINIGVVSVDAHGSLKESLQNETSLASIRAGLRQNSVMDISFDEFFANVEYVMTSLARDNGLHQKIQGVTHQSMLDANNEHLLGNPIFSQLSRAQEKMATGAPRADKMDLEKALRSVKKIEEAEQLIRDATLTKFAVFLDRSIDEIRVDQSLATIGLDSLVSIELKNWMITKEQIDAPVSDQIESSHGFYCCRASKELLRHPLVDLDEAVRDLLNSIGHFAHTREEFLEFSRKAHALAAPGSIGRKLYSQLRAKADDPSVESWIAGPLLKALHIKRRYPLAPFSNFLGTHFDSVIPHSQAERAAVLTRSLCEFKRDRDAGNLEPDFLGERPNCGHSLSWLFNAVREPNIGCDKLRSYPGNEHVAVLRRGHLFKVRLLEGDRIVSYQTLRTTYQAIIDLTLEEKYWTGMLTTDNRDNWATNRQRLLSIDDINAMYLDTIETSVCILCLDDDSLVTREDRVRSGYLGDSFNRWHDKSLQLVVTANGRSGSIFEHSMIDFMTISQLSQRLQNGINTLTPGNYTLDNKAVDHASLVEIPLLTTVDIEARIITLRSEYIAVTAVKKYTSHLITSYGKALFLANSAPIKATMDLTIQLASRLYFGYLPASWETVSTAHFHLGRPEIVQVVLRSVVDFCDAALDNAVPRPEARNKLIQAARECNAQIVKGTEGRNYFRLMDVLEVMSQEQEDEEIPEIFSDPVWKRGYPRLIMQTMMETKLAEDPGYTMEDPESVWMNYTVNDNFVEVLFVGGYHV